MACFLVPAAGAIVASVVNKSVKAKNTNAAHDHQSAPRRAHSFLPKLPWLINLLWGGVVLLALEHLWHGELIMQFPFLTAAQSAEQTSVMLQEMATIGVSMMVLVSVVWVGMVLVTDAIENRTATTCAALPAAN